MATRRPVSREIEIWKVDDKGHIYSEDKTFHYWEVYVKTAIKDRLSVILLVASCAFMVACFPLEMCGLTILFYISFWAFISAFIGAVICSNISEEQSENAYFENNQTIRALIKAENAFQTREEAENARTEKIFEKLYENLLTKS